MCNVLCILYLCSNTFIQLLEFTQDAKISFVYPPCHVRCPDKGAVSYMAQNKCNTNTFLSNYLMPNPNITWHLLFMSSSESVGEAGMAGVESSY